MVIEVRKYTLKPENTPNNHYRNLTVLLTEGFIKSYGMLTVSSYYGKVYNNFVYNNFVLQCNITSFECLSHGSTEMIEIPKMLIFECEHRIIGPFLSNYFGLWGNIATLLKPHCPPLLSKLHRPVSLHKLAQ
jgi:hypothetical protein